MKFTNDENKIMKKKLLLFVFGVAVMKWKANAIASRAQEEKSSSSFNCWRHVSDVAEILSPESDWVAIQMTLKVLLYAKFDEQQNRFYFLRKEEVTSTKPVWLASLAPLSVPLSWLHACLFFCCRCCLLAHCRWPREGEKILEYFYTESFVDFSPRRLLPLCIQRMSFCFYGARSINKKPTNHIIRLVDIFKRRKVILAIAQQHETRQQKEKESCMVTKQSIQQSHQAFACRCVDVAKSRAIWCAALAVTQFPMFFRMLRCSFSIAFDVKQRRKLFAPSLVL